MIPIQTLQKLHHTEQAANKVKAMVDKDNNWYLGSTRAASKAFVQNIL